MATTNENPTFITPKDKKIVYVSIFVVFTCLIAIPSPFSSTIVYFNHFLLSAIPISAASVMILIPVGIYCGIMLSQQEKYRLALLKRDDMVEKATTNRLSFRSSFIPAKEGTIWHIVSCDKFPWTKAMLFLERRWQGVKKTEKRQLGTVEPGKKITFKSGMDNIEGAQWRIMIISQEGSIIEFPGLVTAENIAQTIRAELEEEKKAKTMSTTSK